MIRKSRICRLVHFVAAFAAVVLAASKALLFDGKDHLTICEEAYRAVTRQASTENINRSIRHDWTISQTRARNHSE